MALKCTRSSRILPKTIDPNQCPVDNDGGGSILSFYLLRPARAERRGEGASEARTLSDEGWAQARSLASWLSNEPVTRLLSGSSLKCRQTLEPLAERLGLPIEVDERLDKSADAGERLALLHGLHETQETPGRSADRVAVCLSHSLLQAALPELVGAPPGELEARSERGGAWLIEGQPARASYYAPRSSFVDAENVEGENLGRTGGVIRHSGGGKALSKKPRVAVLDLGSTSFHLLVAEWTPDGDLRRVARERAMLRMGEELALNAKVSPALLDRCVEAVRDLSAFAKENKAEHLLAVGTAALRQATNGPKVVRALEAAMDESVQLLSGEEEARLVYRAIRSRMTLGDRPMIGLDLGGGSLEIVVGQGSELLFEKSLPIGVTRLQGTIRPGDPPTAAERKKLRQIIRKELAPWVDAIAAFEPSGCLAVGGTARALGRLVLRDRGEGTEGLRGLEIRQKKLASLSDELSGVPLSERLERPGVSARRADLLPFGAEILANVLELLGPSAMTVCDWGLREGILLDWLDPAGASRA